MADHTALSDVEAHEESYRARAVGARLRTVRHQMGLSLRDVEDMSTQEFSASALAAYERGEQAIGLPVLRRLAKLYGLGMDDLRPAAAMTSSRSWQNMMTPQPLPMGAPVTVRTRYLGSWASGYEITECLDTGYRLRRLSDGSILPEAIEFRDVRMAT